MLGAACGGQRPRLWLQSWLDDLTADELSPPSLANGCWLQAHALLDRGDIEGAAQALNRSIGILNAQKAPGTASLRALAAYLEARYGSGASAAQTWLEGARLTDLDDPSSLLRSQAALALAQGDPQQALADIDAARVELRRSLEPGSALAELEMLEQMRLEAQELLERMQRGETPALAAPAGRVKIDPLEKPRHFISSEGAGVWSPGGSCPAAGAGDGQRGDPDAAAESLARLWENFFSLGALQRHGFNRPE